MHLLSYSILISAFFVESSDFSLHLFLLYATMFVYWRDNNGTAAQLCHLSPHDPFEPSLGTMSLGRVGSPLPPSPSYRHSLSQLRNEPRLACCSEAGLCHSFFLSSSVLVRSCIGSLLHSWRPGISKNQEPPASCISTCLCQLLYSAPVGLPEGCHHFLGHDISVSIIGGREYVL